MGLPTISHHFSAAALAIYVAVTDRNGLRTKSAWICGMKHVRSPPTTMKTMKTMKTATTLWRRGWIFDSSSCCLLAGRLRRLRRHLHLLRRASNHSSELSKYGARKKSPFRQRTAKCPHSDASLPSSLRDPPFVFWSSFSWDPCWILESQKTSGERRLATSGMGTVSSPSINLIFFRFFSCTDETVKCTKSISKNSKPQSSIFISRQVELSR